MTEKTPVPKKGFSADWLLQGVLTKIGDTVDRLTGRRWVPSSSLATSELIEKLKKLLDSEAKEIPGKGIVVPHNIALKMQWDKFSTDAEGALAKLETELLTAAADHINDSLYYTYAPLKLDVKTDYFTEGVKLFVSYEKISGDEREGALNVTLPAVNVHKEMGAQIADVAAADGEIFIARFEVNGSRRDRRLEFPASRRLSVGRTVSNDLVIDDSSVSKIHSSLVVDDENRLSVADTGSTNGTFVNGQRIAYGMATRLEPSDRVKFGVVEVVFEHIPQAPLVEDKILSEQVAREGTTKVDGLEFTSRVSEQSPIATDAIPDETSDLQTGNEGAGLPLAGDDKEVPVGK